MLCRENSSIKTHQTSIKVIGIEKFKKESFLLNKNNSLFIYTDGITEATDKKNQQFGDERLIEFFKTFENSDSFLVELDRTVCNFTGRIRSDDQTALII